MAQTNRLDSDPSDAVNLNPMRKRGFTLIELLVVITIIMVLMAILFPVLVQARKAAKITTSMSNLRQIGQGIAIKRASNMSTDYGSIPYPDVPASFWECPAAAPANNGIEKMWEIGGGSETWEQYTDRVADSAIAVVDMCWDEVDETNPAHDTKAHLGIGVYLDTHVKKKTKLGEWREFSFWE